MSEAKVTERWAKALQQANQDYADLHPQSQEQVGLLGRYMPGGDTRSTTWFAPYPIVIERGLGCEMRDVDDNVVFDFLGNYTSLIHGHAPSFVTEVIARELARGFIFGTPMKEQGDLAGELVARLPSAELVRFTNSGTEATMLAAGIARRVTGRRRVAVAAYSYHGSYEDLRWQDAEMTGTCVYPSNDIEGSKAALDAGGPLAAVFIEPVLGSGGVITANDAYLGFLRDYCDRTGAVLVFDEVQTFRLSYGGRQEVTGIMPDITTLGKIIGGGLPIGAVAGAREIMSVTDQSLPGALAHAGTFNGHRLAMVGGLAVLKALDVPAIERLNRLGDRLADGIRAVVSGSSVPASVTSCGSMLNLHAARDVGDCEQAQAAQETPLAKYLHLALLNHGVLIAKRGEMAVSTAMTEDTIDFAVTAVATVLAEAEKA